MPGDRVCVTDSVAYSLERLSRLRPLAIVSGRSVDDVTRRIKFTARFIVGNHGAEGLGQALTVDTAPLDIVRLRMAAHVEELRAADVLVEDKRYSLALHYRAAAEQRQAAGIIEMLLTDLPATLRCFHGKCVFNVVTTDAPDKYLAVTSLVERAHCDSAVFVGDDVNDESVFARAPRSWLTVRVGRDDPISQAAFFLDRQAEVATLLDTMLELLHAARSIAPDLARGN